MKAYGHIHMNTHTPLTCTTHLHTYLYKHAEKKEEMNHLC